MSSRYHPATPRRPHIGITPDLSVRPETGVGYYELKTAYADAVTKAGGLPFVLPYTVDPGSIDAYLEKVSGVVVTGGAFDIPPELYGEGIRTGLGPLKEPRTDFETALMKAALARNLPVLGICGGMQLLNVVLGGTLFQDIRQEVDRAQDHEQKHDRTQPHHPVDVREGSLLAEVIGRGQVMVNSTHHQAVNKLGPRVVASAVAPDGVIEAVESPDYGFALGVQWHPELMLESMPLHLGVYRAFINRARDHRTGR